MHSLIIPIPLGKRLLNVNQNPIPFPSTLSQILSRFSSPSRSTLRGAFASASREDDKGTDGGVGLTGESTRPELLPSGLGRELLPRHVAVITDGNSRWARRRGLPTSLGHEAGMRAVTELVNLCGKWGIRVLTVFLFSSNNWSRPKVEMDSLVGVIERGIGSQLPNFSREGVRISTIGDLSKLPKSLQELFTEAERPTKDNTRLHLLLAVNYSGKSDIAQACTNIALKVKENSIRLEDISEELIEQELATSCSEFPCPDLLIRTSGELRLSNFLLWQLSYTELFFSEALWPDFGQTEFAEALLSFQRRQRRYGSRRPVRLIYP